jgi:hypothetical protein
MILKVKLKMIHLKNNLNIAKIKYKIFQMLKLNKKRIKMKVKVMI